MNKGFSLVELIVVIAIMAILVGVAVPTYTAYITKANEGVDEELIGNVEYATKLALVEYETEGVTASYVAADGTLTVTFEDEVDDNDDAAAAAAEQVAGIMKDAKPNYTEGDTSFTIALKSELSKTGNITIG